MFRLSFCFFIGCIMCVIVSCGKKQGDGKLIPIEDFFVKPEKNELPDFA